MSFKTVISTVGSIVRPMLLLICLLAGISGCGQKNTTELLEQSEFVKSLGALPGLSMTESKELRDELARLTGEKATPLLISVAKPADKDNVAVALDDIFTDSQVQRLAKRMQKLVPKENVKFAFNKFQLVEINQLVIEHEKIYQQIREALSKPACDFGIDFASGGYRIFNVDDPFMKNTMEVCVRLEAFDAARLLYTQKDPQQAIGSVGLMFRLIRLMAKEKHQHLRIHAASLRREALNVVRAIAQYPKTNKHALNSLYQILNQELIHWPEDSEAWIGDRCYGLHLYEIARSDQLSLALSPEEVKQFQDEGIYDKLDESVRHNIEEDEAFYLRSMRAIIANCRVPFPQRLKLFDQIRAEADKLRKNDQFPFIASRILISDVVERGTLWQVMDRERCQAWRIGLAIASGNSAPKNKINPHTGKEYQVIVNKKLQRVEVGGLYDKNGNSSRPIFIPLKLDTKD